MSCSNCIKGEPLGEEALNGPPCVTRNERGHQVCPMDRKAHERGDRRALLIIEADREEAVVKDLIGVAASVAVNEPLRVCLI